MKFRDRIIGTVRVRGDRLLPHPKNWRMHPENQRDAMRGVLADLGVARSLTGVPANPAALAEARALTTPAARAAWAAAFEHGTGDILLLDGHLRAEEIRDQPLPVELLDLDEREQAELLATFDPIGDLAKMDRDKFIDLAADFNSTNTAVQALVADLAKIETGAGDFGLEGDGATGGGEEGSGVSGGAPAGEDEDVAPPPDATEELRRKWGTEQGQLWLIAGGNGREHRILCGDCRKPEDVARLFNGARCNIAFTSPPYASQRKYDPESGFVPIHPDKFVDWFEAVQANVRSVLAPDGSWFVNIKEHCEDGERHLYVKDLTIAHKRAWGWRFVDELAWVHAGFPGKMKGRFKNAWEPVFHFINAWPIKFRPEAVGHHSENVPRRQPGDPGREHAHGNIGVGPVHEPGLALPSNVIEVSGGTEATHAAAFPPALPVFFIKAYTDPGDVAYDPFMGSGTTMIAAEQNGRIGYGTELSPKYVAVILERASSKGMKPRLAA